MTAPFLSLRNLVKSYGASAAVSDVSLDIGPGEFFTLLGGSGSGKTTTLMMIAGFVEPDGGKILLDGQDVTGLPPSRREIGIVFQNYALFPHMTVFENVAYPLRIRRRPRPEIEDRVASALTLTKLVGLDGRRPSQLSGGQQQRVALARAIVYEPRLLLMDEPLGALDKKLREHMQAEIIDLQKRLGLAVVYVTHDQTEALTMSDRIAILSEGRIEQVGAPDELYHRPANGFVADFLGDASFLNGIVGSGTAESAVASLGTGEEFCFRASRAVGAGERVRVMLRPEAIRPHRGETVEPNLVRGTVERAIFSGESTRYELRLGDGQVIAMKQPSRAGTGAEPIGANLLVCWHTDDCRQV